MLFAANLSFLLTFLQEYARKIGEKYYYNIGVPISVTPEENIQTIINLLPSNP